MEEVNPRPRSPLDPQPPQWTSSGLGRGRASRPSGALVSPAVPGHQTDLPSCIPTGCPQAGTWAAFWKQATLSPRASSLVQAPVP